MISLIVNIFTLIFITASYAYEYLKESHRSEDKGSA